MNELNLETRGGYIFRLGSERTTGGDQMRTPRNFAFQTGAGATGMRVVAMFEAMKGLIVLAVGFGLLSVINQDVQQLSEELVRHYHLNPANRYPRIFIDAVDRFSDVRLWLLAVLAFGYAALRIAEAYGLWRGRRWAEWFAVASGGIYVPIEIYELFHGLSTIKVGMLTVNVGIVLFMGFALFRSRRGLQPLDEPDRM
jgi:uncharacterized membrane protein (DUF2068 family)